MVSEGIFGLKISQIFELKYQFCEYKSSIIGNKSLIGAILGGWGHAPKKMLISGCSVMASESIFGLKLNKSLN